MADISKIKIGSVEYNIKDATARGTLGALHYLGAAASITSIVDSGTLNVYIITDTIDTTSKNYIIKCYYLGTKPSDTTITTTSEITYTVEYTELANGDVTLQGLSEFVFSTSDNKWHEFGSSSALESTTVASGSHTHDTTISSVEFTGNFTPEGTVSSHSHTIGSTTKYLKASLDNSNLNTTNLILNNATESTKISTISSGYALYEAKYNSSDESLDLQVLTVTLNVAPTISTGASGVSVVTGYVNTPSVSLSSDDDTSTGAISYILSVDSDTGSSQPTFNGNSGSVSVSGNVITGISNNTDTVSVAQIKSES